MVKIVDKLRAAADYLRTNNIDFPQSHTLLKAADIIESLTWVSTEERLPECDEETGVSKVVWCRDAAGRSGFGIYLDGEKQ